MYEDARRCSRMCDRLTSCSTNLAKRVVKDMIYLPVDSYLDVIDLKSVFINFKCHIGRPQCWSSVINPSTNPIPGNLQYGSTPHIEAM